MELDEGEVENSDDDDFDPNSPDDIWPAKTGKKAKKPQQQPQPSPPPLQAGLQIPQPKKRGRPKKDPSKPSKPKKAKIDASSSSSGAAQKRVFSFFILAFAAANGKAKIKKPKTKVMVSATWQKQVQDKLKMADQKEEMYKKQQAELAALQAKFAELEKKQREGLNITCKNPGCDLKLREEPFMVCTGCNKAFCIGCILNIISGPSTIKWHLNLQPPSVRGFFNTSSSCPLCNQAQWRFPFTGK
jgi:hypothetical protein